MTGDDERPKFSSGICATQFQPDKSCATMKSLSIRVLVLEVRASPAALTRFSSLETFGCGAGGDLFEYPETRARPNLDGRGGGTWSERAAR